MAMYQDLTTAKPRIPRPRACLSPEIAESDDGISVDNRIDKQCRPFVFDIFADSDGDGSAGRG
jgi:hypothetical protein